MVGEVRGEVHLLLLQLGHGEEGGEEEHLGELGEDVHQAGLAHLGRMGGMMMMMMMMVMMIMRMLASLWPRPSKMPRTLPGRSTCR